MYNHQSQDNCPISLETLTSSSSILRLGYVSYPIGRNMYFFYLKSSVTSAFLLGRFRMQYLRKTITSRATRKFTNDRLSENIFPFYYNDVYTVSLPPNHRFPMDKYKKVVRLDFNYQSRIVIIINCFYAHFSLQW